MSTVIDMFFAVIDDAKRSAGSMDPLNSSMHPLNSSMHPLKNSMHPLKSSMHPLNSRMNCTSATRIRALQDLLDQYFPR